MSTYIDFLDNVESLYDKEAALETLYDSLVAHMEVISTILDEIKENDPDKEMAVERAFGYWYPHIVSALNNDHCYLGGSMVTMEQTIGELQE